MQEGCVQYCFFTINILTCKNGTSWTTSSGKELILGIYFYIYINKYNARFWRKQKRKIVICVKSKEKKSWSGVVKKVGKILFDNKIFILILFFFYLLQFISIFRISSDSVAVVENLEMAAHNHNNKSTWKRKPKRIYIYIYYKLLMFSYIKSRV